MPRQKTLLENFQVREPRRVLLEEEGQPNPNHAAPAEGRRRGGTQRTLTASFPVTKSAKSSLATKGQPVSNDASIASGSQGRPKSRRPKAKRPAPPDPQPEDQWRASTVPADAKITTMQACVYYRFTTFEFEDLPREYYETDPGWDCWLYREIDIERLAWIKHGGPDAWDAYLDKLKKRTPKTRTFKDPRTRDRSPKIPPPPTQNNGMPPRLERVRDQFEEDDEVWLWNFCIQTLDYLKREYMRYRAQEACLLAVRGQLAYPARPAALLQSSSKVNKLRSILAKAPKCRPTDDVTDVTAPNEQQRAWSPAYLNKVNKALLDVVNECIEPDGERDEEMIRAACWEVYDKYVECISGPTLSESLIIKGSTAHNIEWSDNGMKMFLTQHTASQPSQPSTSSQQSQR